MKITGWHILLVYSVALLISCITYFVTGVEVVTDTGPGFIPIIEAFALLGSLYVYTAGMLVLKRYQYRKLTLLFSQASLVLIFFAILFGDAVLHILFPLGLLMIPAAFPVIIPVAGMIDIIGNEYAYILLIGLALLSLVLMMKSLKHMIEQYRTLTSYPQQ